MTSQNPLKKQKKETFHDLQASTLNNIIEQCEHIQNTVFSENVEKFNFGNLRTPNFRVAYQRLNFQSNQIIGYIVFRVFPLFREAEIVSFAVLPEHQNKGYGTRLLQTVMNELRAKDYKKIKVATTKTNTDYKALELYIKQGFHITNINKSFWSGTETIKLERHFDAP